MTAATRETTKLDGETLWAKLVVEDPAADGPVVVQVGTLRAQASLEVSRQAPVATAALDARGDRRN